MESTNQTHQHNRELTKTEIKIAFAQIIDRLTRLCRAQEEDCYKLEHPNKIRDKYEIPEGVHLFNSDECGEGMRTESIKLYTKHILKWVYGRLSEREFNDLYIALEEFDEIDYGWVFMESPMWFYSEDETDSGMESKANCESDARVQFKALGTRNQKRDNRASELPPIHKLSPVYSE